MVRTHLIILINYFWMYLFWFSFFCMLDIGTPVSQYSQCLGKMLLQQATRRLYLIIDYFPIVSYPSTKEIIKFRLPTH